MKKNKGLVLTATTVIIIILSISVLAALVYFLNSQTSFLSKILKTQTSKSNVDDIVNVCNSLSNREAYYSFCCEKRTVTFGWNASPIEVTCSELLKKSWAANRIKKLSCEGIKCS